MKKGKLYLIPLPISNGSPEDFIPPVRLSLIVSLTYFVVEEPRTARRFLRKAGYQGHFEEIQFHVLNEHTSITDIPAMIAPLISGNDMGLLSEAGMPCIADPGAWLVATAHQNGIRVVPLSGPSSITLALAASGFNGQNFAFHGYLPVKSKEREEKIKYMEKLSGAGNQTQIFIEAPYRNNGMMESILKTCHSGTRLCVACNITGDDEYIKTLSIGEWKKEKPALHKKPCVFLIYNGI
ncbi:MAG: SAM-dependent methyltransferase [Bacteroidales bacterium]|nr:SAM-dependent methyltransferase [Bacteroidales bacterium]